MQKAWWCRTQRSFSFGSGCTETLTRTRNSIQMFLFQDTLLKGMTLAFWYFRTKQGGDIKNSSETEVTFLIALHRKPWPEDLHWLHWLQAWLERLLRMASVDWANLDSFRGRGFLLDHFFRHNHPESGDKLAQLLLPTSLPSPWGKALEFVLSKAPQVGWLPSARLYLCKAPPRPTLAMGMGPSGTLLRSCPGLYILKQVV